MVDVMKNSKSKNQSSEKLQPATATLLPCAPGVCQECARDHDASLPHNQQSLYYQYKFYGENGRWPTWDDAMAHCTPEVRARWQQALKETLRAENAENAEKTEMKICPDNNERTGKGKRL